MASRLRDWRQEGVLGRKKEEGSRRILEHCVESGKA